MISSFKGSLKTYSGQSLPLDKNRKPDAGDLFDAMRKITETAEGGAEFSFSGEELTEMMEPEDIIRILEAVIEDDDDEEDEKGSYLLELLDIYGKRIERYLDSLISKYPEKMGWLKELRKNYDDHESREWMMSSLVVNEQSYTPDPALREVREGYISSPEEEDKSPEFLRLDYENPIFYNQQWTYQRLFIDNEKETSVYRLTQESAERNNFDVEVREDEMFGTKYVESIGGIRDGDNDRYWEYWIVDGNTGEKRIGERAIDRQALRKNEFVEWRLAKEQEHGCGGGGRQYDSFAMDYFEKNKPEYARSGPLAPKFRLNFAY